MRHIAFFAVFSILVHCGVHPVSQPEALKIQELQNFFAEIISPPPEQSKDSTPFKKACYRHLSALYYIVNNPELLKKTGVPQEILNTIPKDLDRLYGHPLEFIKKGLDSQPDSFFKENQDKIDAAVQSFKFNIEQLKSIKVPKLGNSWTAFFQSVLTNYFPSLDGEDKKRILAWMIKTHRPTDTMSDTVLSWVYASGPFFQKYMQLMGDYLEPGDDPELKKLKDGLENIKSGLPHIDWYYIQQYLSELKNKGFELDITPQDSINAASVGEVFHARNKSTGSRMVVKFMRPNIEEIASKEKSFFLNQAKAPAIRSSFNQIAEQIEEEMDYEIEMRKLELGIPAYEGNNSQINVVRAIQNHQFPNSSKYFAMELVDGKTFKDLGKTPTEKLIKSIFWEKILRRFLQQSLFARDNAYFHGDLHEGNIMVTMDPGLDFGLNPTRSHIEEAIASGKIKLVLIDFGNAHSLTQSERQRLKNIFLAASTPANSAKAFLEAMLPNGYSPELLAKLESQVFNAANRGEIPPEKIGHAMDFLIEEGITIPPFLMAFKRSLAMLHNIYKKLDTAQTTGIKTIFEKSFESNLSDILWYDDSASGKTNFWTLVYNIVIDAELAGYEADFLNLDKETYKYYRYKSADWLKYLFR